MFQLFFFFPNEILFILFPVRILFSLVTETSPQNIMTTWPLMQKLFQKIIGFIFWEFRSWSREFQWVFPNFYFLQLVRLLTNFFFPPLSYFNPFILESFCLVTGRSFSRFKYFVSCGRLTSRLYWTLACPLTKTCLNLLYLQKHIDICQTKFSILMAIRPEISPYFFPPPPPPSFIPRLRRWQRFFGFLSPPSLLRSKWNQSKGTLWISLWIL